MPDPETRAGPRRLHPDTPAAPPVKTPLEKLVLPFGLAIAVAAFVFWTVLGYLRFGVWVHEGLLRAVVALGAVLLLAGVIRCARWVAERGPS